MALKIPKTCICGSVNKGIFSPYPLGFRQQCKFVKFNSGQTCCFCPIYDKFCGEDKQLFDSNPNYLSYTVTFKPVVGCKNYTCRS